MRNKTYEFIVKDKEDFEKIRAHADYSSELTGVIQLTNPSLKKIEKEYPGLIGKYVNFDDSTNSEETSDNIETISSKAIVYEKDNKLNITNYGLDTYVFLGNCVKGSIKLKGYPNLFYCLDKGFINLQDNLAYKFKKNKVDENTPIRELLSSKPKKRFKGHLFSLEKAFGDKPISELKFDSYKTKVRKVKVFKDLKILEFNNETNEYKLSTEDNKIYYCKFYGLGFDLAKNQILTIGRKINIATSKVYSHDGGGSLIIDPIIVPHGLELEEIVSISSPRSIPTEIFNAAYAEYNFRKKYSNEN